MSSELTVIVPKSIEEAKTLSATLAPAAMLPDALRQKPADVLAIILTGAELGLAPMQAIRGIRLIKGVPTLSADMMSALCKSRSDVCEYLVCVETTDKRCEMEAKRKGDPRPTKLAFTIEQAQRAGLASNDNYRKHPEAMLRARATSAICRLVFPDLVAGLYEPGEIEVEAPIVKDVTPNRVETKPAVESSVECEVIHEGPTPYEKIKALGVAHGLNGKTMSDFVKANTGKNKLGDLDESDVSKVEVALKSLEVIGEDLKDDVPF